MKFLKPFVLPLSLLVWVGFFKVIHVRELSSDQNKVSTKERFITYEQLRNKLHLSDDRDVEAAQVMPTERIVSNDKLLERLAPQLSSRSVEQVGRYIENNNIPLGQRIELLREIITNNAYGFSYDDAVQLVLDVANLYQPGSADQKRIFKLFTQYYDLLKKSSPLFIAVKYGYKQTILPLLAWSMSMVDKYPEIKKDLQGLKYYALVRAVDEEDLDALRNINAFSQGVSKEQATDLIWYIAQTGKSAFMLPELKKLGGDINQARGKMTPLIQAVVDRHLDVVKELVALDVELDKIANLEFGTALQRAIVNRDVPMENLLRAAGARE